VFADRGAVVLCVPSLLRLHEEPHDYFRFSQYGLAALASGRTCLERTRRRAGFVHAGPPGLDIVSLPDGRSPLTVDRLRIELVNGGVALRSARSIVPDRAEVSMNVIAVSECLNPAMRRDENGFCMSDPIAATMASEPTETRLSTPSGDAFSRGHSPRLFAWAGWYLPLWQELSALGDVPWWAVLSLCRRRQHRLCNGLYISTCFGFRHRSPRRNGLH
jgi:hypothetical protein